MNHVKSLGSRFLNQLVKLGGVTLVATMLSVTTIDAVMSLSGHDITVEASKKSKAKAKRKMVNKAIALELQQDQGLAQGTLDENLEPTDNGTPDPDFAWAMLVTKIRYTSTDDLEMYVTTDFMNLSISDKTQVARYAQNAAFSVLGDNYKKWDKSYIVHTCASSIHQVTIHSLLVVASPSKQASSRLKLNSPFPAWLAGYIYYVQT